MPRPQRQHGFTLLELLFVLVIVALLASLAAPMLTGSIDQAREAALKQDLRVMRQALDDYQADHGRHPSELNELVEKRYLRSLPVEPITQRKDGWNIVRTEGERGGAGVTDVRSGSEERARDGSYYRDW
ncbi:type II secretion system protein [Leptospira sp. SA-E8]|uniref:type II secretion system protein n=1 Tax=Leptospira sp. SA-E8 TaxID=3422259 RepID=UPI003EB9EABE